MFFRRIKPPSATSVTLQDEYDRLCFLDAHYQLKAGSVENAYLEELQRIFEPLYGGPGGRQAYLISACHRLIGQKVCNPSSFTHQDHLKLQMLMAERSARMFHAGLGKRPLYVRFREFQAAYHLT